MFLLSAIEEGKTVGGGRGGGGGGKRGESLFTKMSAALAHRETPNFPRDKKREAN